MKSKTVKKVLRKQFDEFLKSITDKKVRKLVEKNSIITGGAITSMLCKEQVNDYDVYFTNAETVRAVAFYYTDLFNKISEKKYTFEILDGTLDYDPLNVYGIDEGRIKIKVVSAGIAHTGTIDDTFQITPPVNPKLKKDKQKFQPAYISSNAITLTNKFQLIIRFFGNVNEIHSNYDFAHCTCSWEASTNKLLLPSEALECMLTKELRYKGSKYPLASIIRTRKFISRGYTINAGQYLKMCMQLNYLDLTDKAVLEDQLTGVDALYFAMLFACIDKDKLAADIDGTYFITLIDRFF